MKIKDTNLNWTLNVVARVVVGLVFIFSSFVKGVDPMGTSFKITEYLTAWTFFGMSFDWLVPLATFMAMVLIVVEFTTGVMLLFGTFRRTSAWVLVLMMLFFTATTLFDAITNEVTDCGCFGDAIKLTNWQTFWKNIALDIPTVWIFLTRDLRRKQRFERDMLITIFAIVAMVLFGLYNINNEPCIDFRSWKVGNQMIDMDENAQVKSYVTYVNKETGERDEFLSEELVKRMEDPAWEEQWEWESSRVEDPHEIKADGFSMLDMDMNDHAKELIGSEDYLLIATIHHLDKVNEDGLDGLEDAAEWAEEHGVQMVVLTSALPEDVQSFLYHNGLDNLDFYFADVTAIETMARSNPGFLLLKGGKVLGKWHYRHADDIEDFILR
ncbi:MAG: DoxX family protein [Bacteroidales bacterium]|nr:DoxX family protein [Bacteroidales bacterium]